LKFKLALLLGLKLLAPGWTFLLSLWVYVALFGWRLAVVVMLVLLAHELGHYAAFRAYGLPVRLPSFVPLFGAFTAGAPPDNLEHDANIALAGPLTGMGLAAVCLAIGIASHDRFWFACADVSAFLNLFNLIPMPPFDGGRIIGAVWPPLWLAGFVFFVAFAVVFHIPILFIAIVGLLGLPALLAAWRGQVDPRAANMTFEARLRVSAWYLATLLGLFFVLARAHGAAAPA
jgi:Zn-dependent protease